MLKKYLFLGFLNANVGKNTIKLPGVQDGIVCDCPDDCDQTIYTKVKIKTYVKTYFCPFFQD